jgi:phosphoribosylformylglycinamidine cyclo-ligase
MKQSAYKDAGVDIDAGDELVERIKPAVKNTFRSGVMGGLGGFGAFFDPKASGYTDPLLVSSTDGVGTKIKIAIDTGRHDTIGIDLVAMCVNDLIVQGAEPLFFLDYFATGKLDVGTAETVITGIAAGCSEAGCALIGGETAEMPGMYAPGDYDLAGFTVGAVNRDEVVTGERIEAGDVILGLASSGFHSNGYSLVRKIATQTQGHGYEDEASFAEDMTVGEALLTPTRIYVKPLLKALKIKEGNGKSAIRGMAHITGGGLVENIPRVLPDGTCAHLDAAAWPLPECFKWLKEVGQLDAADMARTLNCGIGMVVICAPAQVQEIIACLEEQGESVYTIGQIEKADADAPRVPIDNLEETWRT